MLLFFSRFGLIVSLLGLRRTLPPASVLPGPHSPAPPPTATCGMELTVSVSTVMFGTEGSPVGLFLDELSCESDRRV
jgi:hypothetical protein